MRIAIDVFNSIVDGKDGTLDLIRLELPHYGYLVGGNGKPLVFESAPGVIASWAMRDIGRFVDSTTARFIGWWTDKDTGKVYIDGTDWFPDQVNAARIARERHEIAFWDIAGKQEIRLAYADGE